MVSHCNLPHVRRSLCWRCCAARVEETSVTDYGCKGCLGLISFLNELILLVLTN